jgi:hypothetical protein
MLDVQNEITNKRALTDISQMEPGGFIITPTSGSTDYMTDF